MKPRRLLRLLSRSTPWGLLVRRADSLPSTPYPLTTPRISRRSANAAPTPKPSVDSSRTMSTRSTAHTPFSFRSARWRLHHSLHRRPIAMDNLATRPMPVAPVTMNTRSTQ